jgi:lysosomal acid phosphatase
MLLFYLYLELALAEIKFFVGVSREGITAPERFMRWDNLKNWPNGPGELTSEGMRQHYILGNYLRDRYITKGEALSSVYSPHELLIHALSKTSSQQSAISQTLGLYPPEPLKDKLESLYSLPQSDLRNVSDYKALKYTPNLITAHYSKDYIDPLLNPLSSCLEYKEHLERKRSSSAIKEIYYKYRNVIQVISTELLISINEAEDLALDLIQSIVANKAMGYPYPKVFDDYWLQEANQFYIEIRTYELHQSEYLARFSATQFLEKLSMLFDFKVLNYLLLEKGYLYTSTDITIMNIFAALNIPLLEQPPFGSVFLIELHLIAESYFVKILYNGKALSLPELPELCPFASFRDYVRIKIFYDEKLACQSIDKLINLAVNTSEINEISSLIVFDLIVMFVVLTGIYTLIKKLHNR